MARVVVTIALGLALVAAPAWAQAPGPTSQPSENPPPEMPWRAEPSSDGADSTAPADPNAELTATTQPAALEPTSLDPQRSRRDPVLHFDELTFDLGAGADWSWRKVSSQSPGTRRYTQTDKAQRLEQDMGLSGAGQIINDRFVRYDFDIRGGFSQDRFSETRPGAYQHDDPHGGLLEYDTHATFFPAGKITANVFASKLDARVPRMFLPSLDQQRERYGAELLYNDRVLPMRLTFEDDYERLQSYSRSREDDELNSDRRLEYETTWQPTDYHQMRLDYQYDDSRQQYSGTLDRFDTVRNYFTLNDALQFGADHRSRLDTVARYQDESGDLARDVSEFAPQLRLQHTDALATIYRAQYLQESYQGVEVRQFRGDVGLAYQANDWLNADLDAYGITDRADHGSDEDEWGGVATLGINRENKLGRFTANFTYTYASQSVNAATTDGVVVGETVTLRDPLPAILAHTDVRRYSILVTSVDGRKPYMPGRDYLVVQSGRYTSLLRIPTGRITDGQSVLVSYLYNVAQSFDLSRNRGDIRVQQAFNNGWTPYYATSLQWETIEPANLLAYEPRDINRQRLGADYRQARWSAGGELEYNYDTTDPYDAVHIRGDATFYQRAPHELSGRGTYSFFHFKGIEYLVAHDVSLLDLGVSYRFLLDTRLELDAAAAYRFEHDTASGTTNGVDLGASLNWKLGLFTAIFEVEYNQLDLPGSNDGSFAAWIRLRRDFPIIGRREP